MGNSSVVCKSTSCVHNNNLECTAGVIVVRGAHATKYSEAKCDTYVEEGGYGFDNFSSLYDSEKNLTDEIKCSAVKCKYNEDKNCTANQIEITAANASCATFKCSM
ncbi:DUF1540 domain-containing protein [Terrisporobacter sp.]